MTQQIIVFVAIFFLLVILSTILWFFIQRKQAKLSQQVGLSILQMLQNMLAHVQRHRGLSYGASKGVIALTPEIADLKHRISSDIELLEKSRSLLITSERWIRITEQWAKISAQQSEPNSGNILAQHNTLAKMILLIISDTVSIYKLTQLRSADSGNSISYLWQELLTTAELLGQARALGTGIAAAGYSESIDRARLTSLVKEIEGNSDLLWVHISNHQILQDHINKFLLCIEEHINIHKPSVSPEDFFRLGSHAIDGLYEYYKNELMILREKYLA